MPRPVLVIGESGQLAQALKRAGGDRVASAGRGQFNLATQDPSCLIREIAPSAIVNAAAYTDVNGAEDDREAAWALNCHGPARLAECAAEANLPFVHISTDYVFNGRDGAPHTEDSQTAPINAYGESKRDGENAVLAANPASVIIRTSWLFDQAGGSFLNAILARMESGQPLKIVDDQISAPTFADDLAHAILTILTSDRDITPERAGIFHYAGGPHASWLDFARRAAELAKPRLPEPASISAVDSSAFPQIAERPLDTRLDATRLQSIWNIGSGDWDAGLQRVIASRY